MIADPAENRRRRAYLALALALGLLVPMSVLSLLAFQSGSVEGVTFEHIDPQHHLKPDPGLWIIQNEANWSAFWYGFLASADRQPGPPHVDFDEYTVIAISQGTRPTTRYNLTVTAVERNGAGLVVKAQETDPGTGCLVAPILTSIYDIIRVPKTTTSVGVLLQWNRMQCSQATAVIPR